MIAFDAVWIPIALTVLILVVAMRPMRDNFMGVEALMRGLWGIPLLLVWLVYLLVRVFGDGR